MPYVKKTTKAGNYIVVEKYYSSRYGCKGIARGPNYSRTPEKVEKLNQIRSEQNLAYLIDSNFGYGDIHLVLTYQKEKRPDVVGAKEELAKFLRKSRKAYSNAGTEFKYIAVTEYESKAIHHHLIIPGIDIRLLLDCWTNGAVRPRYLDDTGDYKRLSDYLIKETSRTFKFPSGPGKRRYSCSKNLAKPKVTKEVVSAKKFSHIPKPQKGYIVDIDSIVLVDSNDFNGYPYMRYRLKKISERKAYEKKNVRSRKC